MKKKIGRLKEVEKKIGRLKRKSCRSIPCRSDDVDILSSRNGRPENIV